METSLEHILCNSYKADMISYIKAHPEDFEEAIQLALSEKQPYSRLAAWLLESCMEHNDLRLKKHIPEMIELLPRQKESQQRSLMIILQKMEIKENYEGKLYNSCVNIWEKICNMPSVRYNAFKIIIMIAEKHPDLYNEVLLLSQNQYIESLSEAVKKGVFKMVDSLKPEIIN